MTEDYAGALASGSSETETQVPADAPKTWDDAVKELGYNGAVKAYPELNPNYAKDTTANQMDSQDTTVQWNAAVNRLGLAGAEKQYPEWDPKTKAQNYQAASVAHAAALAGTPQPTTAREKVSTPTPANPATNAINAQQTASDQAMDSLISEYTSGLAAIAPYESGQVGTQDSAKASQIGAQIAAGGQSAQDAFANTTATQNADYQKIAAADTQGAQGVTSALGDLKSADSLALGVSPYAGLLTALTSGASYRAETNPQSGASTLTNSTMPAWLANAYANAVGSNALSVSGATTPGTGTSAGSTAATSPSTDSTGITGGP